MKPIPISAAERIAKEYGYDQVIIVARKVGDDPEPHGEHVTTYGVDKAHCAVAAKAGDFLKYKVMGWVSEQEQAGSAAPDCVEIELPRKVSPDLESMHWHQVRNNTIDACRRAIEAQGFKVKQ